MESTILFFAASTLFIIVVFIIIIIRLRKANIMFEEELRVAQAERRGQERHSLSISSDLKTKQNQLQELEKEKKTAC